MGFWRKWQYEEFVKAHADSSQRFELLPPSGVTFDAATHPDIAVRYDSMPQWMARSNFITLDNGDKPPAVKVRFRLLLHAYLTEKANYIRDVNSRLGQILQRATGLALFSEISDTNRSLSIVPFHGSDINAEAAWRNQSDVVDSTAAGRPVDYGSDTDKRVGTGLGTDSVIDFTPGIFVGSVMAEEGYAPDEVLFHEMIHASRIMRGKLDSVPVNAGYDDEEEYLAIVLSNIYLSEKGQVRFTASHGNWPKGFVPTGANALLTGADADNFLRNVQHADMPPVTLLENFRSSQPAFYDALAHLPPNQPKYNWVRDYELGRASLSQQQ
jgi:hypothetical protein